jgi:hypothetical protein
MASQAAAMVAVMVAFLFSRTKRQRGEDEPIVYGTRAEADEHRKKNLGFLTFCHPYGWHSFVCQLCAHPNTFALASFLFHASQSSPSQT